MKQHCNLWTTALAAAGLLFVAACATMMSGETQNIKISSSPPGVTVTADPGGYRAATPAEMVLPRASGGYRLKFEKEGYAPVEVSLTSSTNGWVWGNILFGGLIGLVVDFNTGAAYTLSPETVHADLDAIRVSAERLSKNTLLVFETDGSLLIAITLGES